MFLPIVVRKDLKGANGRNWPGFVILGKKIERPAAIFAQEAYEARHKLNPISLFRRLTSKESRRRMEYMGHEIEVQVCARLYGQPEVQARFREAEAMRRGYGGLFSHMSLRELETEMQARSGAARSWVQKHIKHIERYR